MLVPIFYNFLRFIDSSEMVSTYGSSPHEIRGFVDGGWRTCANQDGRLITIDASTH